MPKIGVYDPSGSPLGGLLAQEWARLGVENRPLPGLEPAPDCSHIWAWLHPDRGVPPRLRETWPHALILGVLTPTRAAQPWTLRDWAAAVSVPTVPSPMAKGAFFQALAEGPPPPHNVFTGVQAVATVRFGTDPVPPSAHHPDDVAATTWGPGALKGVRVGWCWDHRASDESIATALHTLRAMRVQAPETKAIWFLRDGAEHGFRNWIELNEFVPDVDVLFPPTSGDPSQWYRCCDVMTTTESRSDWPRTLTAAMAAGVPVACPDDWVWTDLGAEGRADLIPTPFSGFYGADAEVYRSVDPSSAAHQVLNLASSPRRWDRIDAGSTWARALTWEASARRYLELMGLA